MSIETHISPKDPLDQLLDAKEEVRQYLLGDDTTFAVLQEKLFDSNTEDANYPDFSVEPTLERDESMQSMLGLRIKKSGHSSESEVGTSLALYEHLDLGKLDRKAGLFHASPELEGLIASAGLEKSAALNVAQAWRRGVEIIGERMGDLVIVDPHLHTIELKSVVEANSTLVNKLQEE